MSSPKTQKEKSKNANQIWKTIATNPLRSTHRKIIRTSIRSNQYKTRNGENIWVLRGVRARPRDSNTGGDERVPWNWVHVFALSPWPVSASQSFPLSAASSSAPNGKSLLPNHFELWIDFPNCCGLYVETLYLQCVLPAGVEFYSSGFDSNDPSTYPRRYPIVLTGMMRYPQLFLCKNF